MGKFLMIFSSFPISPIDTLGKLDLDKMEKFEASKQRFQEHFIGMKKEAWVKRQPNEKDGDTIIQDKSEKPYQYVKVN